jgi:glycosyltransferase involved in cell wall biosynthesis
MRSLRLFLAGTSFKPAYGGPALSVAMLANELAVAGVEVGVWAPDQSAPDAPQLREPMVRRLRGNSQQAVADFGQIDILHDNGLWWPHNHGLSALAKLRSISRIVSARGMLEPWARAHKAWKKRLAWALYQRRDLACAAAHHATSEQEATNLRALSLGVRVATIPNGVDIPSDEELIAARNSRRPPHTRTALFMGRLYPVKGLPMLVDAWAQARPEGWRLVLAGPDQAGHRAEIERRIAAHRLKSVVQFLGPIHPADRLRTYADADLFILPSHSESFGMAVGEAFAHGLPVLTTTGVPWPQIEGDRLGWRVAPTVESIRDALIEATECDEVALDDMGARGRELVRTRYGWPAAAKAMIGLYQSALETHHSPIDELVLDRQYQ